MSCLTFELCIFSYSGFDVVFGEGEFPFEKNAKREEVKASVKKVPNNWLVGGTPSHLRDFSCN